MKHLIFTLSLICFTATTAFAQIATVYQHTDFRGNALELKEGMNAGPLPVVGNDQASSIRIAPGWKVTLYEHDPSRGRTLVLTEDTRNFIPLGFNDIVSNILVERAEEGCGGIKLSLISVTDSEIKVRVDGTDYPHRLQIHQLQVQNGDCIDCKNIGAGYDPEVRTWTIRNKPGPTKIVYTKFTGNCKGTEFILDTK